MRPNLEQKTCHKIQLNDVAFWTPIFSEGVSKLRASWWSDFLATEMARANQTAKGHFPPYLGMLLKIFNPSSLRLGMKYGTTVPRKFFRIPEAYHFTIGVLSLANNQRTEKDT